MFGLVLIISARKSTLGARFCGIFSTVFGAVILSEAASIVFSGVGPPTHEWKQVRLPWSLTIGSAWMAAGAMLFAFGRLPLIGHWVSSPRMARLSGIAALLVISAVTLSWVDASSYSYTDWSERGYPHFDPPTLASWWNAAFDWSSRWLLPFDTVAVWPSLVALVLILALTGIRRRVIGLRDIRIALLLFGLGHVLVVAINFTRLAMEGRLGIFLRYFADPFGYPHALAFTAFCLALGAALYRVRSDWWDRDIARTR